MKKITIFFLAGLMVCLCGCSNRGFIIDGSQNEEFFNETSYVSTKLNKYSGTWYGYGTDSTVAVTSGKTLKFLDDSRFEFGGEIFVLVDEYTAESVADYDSSSGDKDSKMLLVFGMDSSGDYALECYGIKKSDRKQFSESMYYYRQPSRENYQDFEKGEATNSAPVPEPKPEPTPQQKPQQQPKPDPVNYEKIGFQQRYDILSSKTIEGDTQSEMNAESKELFDQWDLLLNDVYQYLKANKGSSEFAAIKKDELRWIKEKEAAIERTYEEYEGGSMAPLMANCTGIDYTQHRCEYLISLID